MTDIVMTNHLTLDGVMQAPGRPEVMGRVLGEGMAQGGALLLGRRTYQDFYDFWPKQENNPFTEVLDRAQKYVASTTLEEPLPWSNSTLLAGDAAKAVSRLKEQAGKHIAVLGSGEVVPTTGVVIATYRPAA